MNLDVLLKVGGMGFFISVLNSVLKSSGKGDWIMFINLAGVVLALGIVMSEVVNLLNTVKVMFML